MVTLIYKIKEFNVRDRARFVSLYGEIIPSFSEGLSIVQGHKPCSISLDQSGYLWIVVQMKFKDIFILNDNLQNL